ncbi:MAG: hypothetical protein V1735_06655 [Nanoarchaeota archaeon]
MITTIYDDKWLLYFTKFPTKPKVCVSIIQDQLRDVGFSDVNCKLLTGENNSIDYNALGYYFITAKKEESAAGQNPKRILSSEFGRYQ